MEAAPNQKVHPDLAQEKKVKDQGYNKNGERAYQREYLLNITTIYNPFTPMDQ